MNVRGLFTDDDAVSPVIGVILMVAITVILAAVIGAFVLNLGDQPPEPPQVSWDVSESDGEVEFTHTGGDQISDSATLEGSLDGNNVELPNHGYTAGDTVSVNDSHPTGSPELDSGWNNGNTVRLVWSADGSSDTAVIGEHTLADQP